MTAMRNGRHGRRPEKSARRYVLAGVLWLLVAAAAVVIMIIGETQHLYGLGEAGLVILAISLGLAVAGLARARSIGRISRQVRADMLGLAGSGAVARRPERWFGRLRRRVPSTGLTGHRYR
jgi:hypothetical protein